MSKPFDTFYMIFWRVKKWIALKKATFNIKLFAYFGMYISRVYFCWGSPCFVVVAFQPLFKLTFEVGGKALSIIWIVLLASLVPWYDFFRQTYSTPNIFFECICLLPSVVRITLEVNALSHLIERNWFCKTTEGIESLLPISQFLFLRCMDLRHRKRACQYSFRPWRTFKHIPIALRPHRVSLGELHWRFSRKSISRQSNLSEKEIFICFRKEKQLWRYLHVLEVHCWIYWLERVYLWLL